MTRYDYMPVKNVFARKTVSFFRIAFLALCISTSAYSGILRNLFVFDPSGFFRYNLIASGQELTNLKSGSYIIANMACFDFSPYEIVSVRIGGGGAMMSVDPFISSGDKREHDFDGGIEPALLCGGTVSTPPFLPVELTARADLDILKFSSSEGLYEYDGFHSTLNLGLMFYPVRYMAAGVGACYRYVGGVISIDEKETSDFSNVDRWRPYIMAKFSGIDRRYSTSVSVDLTDARWDARRLSVRVGIDYRIIPDWVHRSF